MVFEVVMLHNLRDSHRQLEISAATLSKLIDAHAPDEEAIEAARWDIGTRIMKHMALEDRHLFANMARDARPAVRSLAQSFQDEYARHVVEYAEHAKRWTAERVVADWNGYRAVTRQQLEALRVRIHKVETQLFPLAEGMSIDMPQAPSRSWTREAFAIKDSITSAPSRAQGAKGVPEARFLKIRSPN